MNNTEKIIVTAFGYYRIFIIRIITVRVVMQHVRVRRGNGTVPTENGT